jgi:hypothetical protein
MGPDRSASAQGQGEPGGPGQGAYPTGRVRTTMSRPQTADQSTLPWRRKSKGPRSTRTVTEFVERTHPARCPEGFPSGPAPYPSRRQSLPDGVRRGRPPVPMKVAHGGTSCEETTGGGLRPEPLPGILAHRCLCRPSCWTLTKAIPAPAAATPSSWSVIPHQRPGGRRGKFGPAALRAARPGWAAWPSTLRTCPDPTRICVPESTCRVS